MVAMVDCYVTGIGADLSMIRNSQMMVISC